MMQFATLVMFTLETRSIETVQKREFHHLKTDGSFFASTSTKIRNIAKIQSVSQKKLEYLQFVYCQHVNGQVVVANGFRQSNFII